MKTEYKTLWIDDDIRSVRGPKRSIDTLLTSHGIAPEFIDIEAKAGDCPTKSKKFIDALADPELDMIFVDFNMPDENGLEIIEHIRKAEHHYHLPIIFYSGDDFDEGDGLEDKVNDLNKAEQDFRKIIDGIYFCRRDDIAEKAKLILNSLLDKENKLQHSRGLLMDRVSEIDAKIALSIRHFFSAVPPANQQSILKMINSKLKSKSTKSATLLDCISKKSYEEAVTYLLDTEGSMDTLFRAELLRHILRYLEDKAPHGDVISAFFNNLEEHKPYKCLNSLRNTYAHQTAAQIKVDHTTEKCKYVRTETRKHLKNLDDLMAKSQHSKIEGILN